MDIPLQEEVDQMDQSHLSKRRKILHHDNSPDSRHDKYTVAWICALSTELAAAKAMLDDIYEPLPIQADDTNTYTLGNIQGHNVVIACLPTDRYGIINAASVATNIKRTFTAIRVGLMVGIGGGVPSQIDVRLGDIVVGTRVMQTDLGKIIAGEHLERTAIPRIPHQLLGTAVSALRAKHETGPSRVPYIVQQRLEKHGYGHPSSPDHLFQANYHHQASTADCSECDHSRLVPRSQRTGDIPVIHYGAIASGSQVIKSSVFRDEAARQLNVICFEMEAAGLMDIIPCLPIRGICDYSDSHKNKDWQKYAAATAAAYARELLEELPLSETHLKDNYISIPEQPPSKEHRKQFLDSLKFEQMHSRKSSITKANTKTCRWFLKHPEYEAWLNPEKLAQHHGFLWICGKPGAGKSTIMEFVHSSMKSQTQHKRTVIASFFFNARGGDLEKSIVGMYRSLLLQLLEGYPDLQAVLDDPEIASTLTLNTCPPLSVLKRIFEKAIALLGRRPFTCFIDALDECDEQQVLDMVQYFEDLAERSTAQNVPLRVCFSSRHYPYIIIRWGTRLTLEHQSGHVDDLEAYVKDHLRANDPDIMDRILEKAAGVFMWVVLVVEILNREYARGAMSLRKKLEELPSRLSDLFKDILRRDQENSEELLLCFLWILCARHPLGPDEFYHALWSGLLSKGLVDSRIPDPLAKDTNDGLPRSYRFVISCSKGLAEVTRSHTPYVQFIHESVRDFLIKDRGLYDLWPDLGLDWEGQAHEKLKHCCSIYTNHGPASVTPTNQENISIHYPFLQYASQNILYHANAAANVVPQDNFLASLNLQKWIELNNYFERKAIRTYSSEASLLYILADKGCPELIRTKLREDPEIHICGEWYKYPLFSALAHGDKASTAALLNLPSTFYEGVDITEGLNRRTGLREYENHTPLSWAVENGRAGLAKVLLEQGAEVDSRFSGETPLWIASARGHKDIAKLLIERGADINAADPFGKTPLGIASSRGHKDIVGLLIDRGADVNTADPFSKTLLEILSSRGHKDIVKLLIERGADINNVDLIRRTPLWMASLRGHKDIVELLIERGADINAVNSFGRTPLWIASSNSHKDIVTLLIERGADINATDSLGWTPLRRALAGGHEDVAKLLIERGANGNC